VIDLTFVGAPGSGKGTLCKKLSEEHDFSHVSIGDLLRSVASSSCTDITVVNSVKNADLLPVEVLAPILEAHIDKEKRIGPKKILIDGFPRRLDQAEPIEALVSPKPTSLVTC
jgi:adenylate kinase family enzyme